MKTATSAQQRAITTRGNVLVVAGAGTGKTSTLVERCVRLLVDERCSLDRILMVTFTDAAATEMRHRISEQLHERFELARENDSELAHHLDQQIALLDTAHISTLSSFCLRLMRDHFYELGLDPQAAVLDASQTEPLIGRTFDTLLEGHYAGRADDDRAMQALVRAYGDGSDIPVRALVIKIHRYAQTLSAPAQWYSEQMERHASGQPEFWRAAWCAAFVEWREFWKAALQNRAPTVPALARCLRELDAVTDPYAARLEELLRCLKAALADSKAWAGKKTRIREAKKFIEEVETLSSWVPSNGNDPLLADWQMVRPHMLALLKLAQRFAIEFGAAKRELGGLDFADVDQYSLDLLLGSKREGITSVARVLQDQFLHVFVDEYQDINEAQDRIIAAVSRVSGNRFLVGDVKQSIYRFRLADPKIFGGYRTQWSGPGAGGSSLPLSDNFRSREGILKFVNALFGALMRPNVGGVEYPSEAHLVFANAAERAALAHRAEDPRVELHLFTDRVGAKSSSVRNGNDDAELLDLDDVEREARLIARRFKELRERQHLIWDRQQGALRPVAWRDMAVLLRSPKDRVETFAKEFHRAGVPLRAARAGFYEAAEVRDFICLMRLLDNPLQDVPLVAVLRSPFVGLSDDELAEIRIACPRGPFWRAEAEFRSGGPADIEAARSAWRKVKEFNEQFESWRTRIRQSALSRCLETILVETHYEAMLAADARGAERVANVRRLIELTRGSDSFQRQGLYRFLCFVDAQQEAEIEREPAPVTAGDAVQLMSIHKSKGLEFPIVALANIGGRFNERSLNDTLLLCEPLGLCPKVFPSDADIIYPSLAHWLARRAERRELWGEEMRLLYVALTRARDTLILTGTAPREQAGEPWTSTPPESISDWALMNSSCYLDWLRLWLPQHTRDADWQNEHSGCSSLLRWKMYAADDPVLGEQIPNERAAPAPTTLDEPTASQVWERVTFEYPFADATEEPAKTSVSALRRQADVEEEARPWFQTLGTKPQPGISSREVGSAHHALLEVADLRTATDTRYLCAQADLLVARGVIDSEHRPALDVEAIARFWRSDVGTDIRACADYVHRELPFTARFAPAELATLNLGSLNLRDEFVVLQGVIDLAVLGPKEIWVLDFKTDRVQTSSLALKTELYRPQLALYGLALERIYQRPVTRRWLHFLFSGETILV